VAAERGILLRDSHGGGDRNKAGCLVDQLTVGGGCTTEVKRDAYFGGRRQHLRVGNARQNRGCNEHCQDGGGSKEFHGHAPHQYGCTVQSISSRVNGL